MAEDVASFGGGPVNCTANDTRIARATVQQVNEPVVCSPNTNVTLNIDAEIQAGPQSDRADMGVWIATQGDALTGTCNHYNLVPGATGTVNPDGDQCAGMVGGTTAVLPLGQLTIPCNIVSLPATTDRPAGTYLQINACLAWDVPGQDGVCPNNRDGQMPAGQPTDFRAATIPGTPSKCNCEPFFVPAIPQSDIVIVKVTAPASSPVDFDFTATGAGTTSPFILDTDAGSVTPTASRTFAVASNGDTRTFTEATEAGWDLTDLVCSATSVGATAGTQSTFPVDLSTRTASVQPRDGETVTCTFTNTQRPSLTIQKLSVGGTETFDYTASGTGMPASFTRNTASANPTTDASFEFTGAQLGDKYVTESAEAGWRLTNITCTANGATIAIGTGQGGSFAQGTSAGYDAGDNTVKVTAAAGSTPTCTFTNEKLGTITIIKQTDPDGATGSFSFAHTIGGNSNPVVSTPFSLSDGGQQVFSNVAAGTYSVTETVPAGWDLVASGGGATTACTDATTNSNITLGTGAASINLAAGESVTCTFVNRKRATVTANKLQNGSSTLTGTFKFEIRSGASLASAGTVIASGTAALSGGAVTFTCAAGVSPSICTTVGGAASIVPGAYQFCEIDMLAGWSNNIAGFTPNGGQPEGADNGDECINITLAAGASGFPSGITVGNVSIDNTAPPGGDARTIGYWKNHSCSAPGNQADVLSPLLVGNPLPIGTNYAADNAPNDPDYFVSTCADAVSLLDKRDVNSGKKMASDPAFGLAAQLTAALLNLRAEAGTCQAATDAILAAQILLDQVDFDGVGTTQMTSAQKTQANLLAGTLDRYNNNTLCGP